MRHLLLLLALLCVGACRGSLPTHDGSGNTASPSPSPTEALSAYGEKRVEGCSALGAGTEACAFTFQLDPARCANRGCTKLVIFFSGGEMTCPVQDAPLSYLTPYASDGYVAVCARIYESSTGSGEFPYHREAPRVDLLVRSILADSLVQAAWNGDYLLISGVSHGATAPVIAMARNAYDDSWKGAKYTAACFYDGMYDTTELFNFIHSNNCYDGSQAFSVTCDRMAGRYGCATSSPCSCSTADTALDSIASVSGAAFAVRDWKLIECGSSFNGGVSACTKDIMPAGPIQSLCTQINGTAGSSCEYASLSLATHFNCSFMRVDVCKDWFNSRAASYP